MSESDKGLESEQPTSPDQLAAQDQEAAPDRSGFRIEATVHPGPERDLSRVADLDLDRIPDPDGQIRLLLTLDDAIRLLEAGYEVRLHRLLPVQPLDPGLVESDEAVGAWLEERVKGLERAEGSAEQFSEGS